jgi:hypothetical protein
MSSSESRRLTPAERFPWLRYLLIPFVLPIALAVFAVILPLFGALLIFGVTWNYIMERRFRKLLRRKGRFLSWKKALQCMNANPGTLIIESPTIGWGIARAWWTADDVSSLATCPMPSEMEYRKAASGGPIPEWESWCWKEYLSPENGRAHLLRVWNGNSLEFRLRKLYPQLKVVSSWSAVVHSPALPRENALKGD